MTHARRVAAVAALVFVALAGATPPPALAVTPATGVSSVDLAAAPASRQVQGPLLASTVVAAAAPVVWWSAPVAGARCNSPFWELRHDGPNGSDYRHQGRDLLRYRGAPLRAVANGTVVKAAAPSGYRGGYGYQVVLKHGKGQIRSVYTHMTGLKVRVGQWIRRGQIVGYMGSSGWSNGVHTHFEIREWGTPINPDKFLRARGVTLCR